MMDWWEEQQKLWDQGIRAASANSKFGVRNSESQSGQQKTAPEGGVRYQARGAENSEIKHPSFSDEEIRTNSITLQSMAPIRDLRGDEFTQNGRRLFDNVVEFFQRLGGRVHSERFGDVMLTKSSARSDLRHGLTRAKITSFAAIPDVLNKGTVIGVIQKNADLERIVVAAPITISGQKYYMGVMLQRDSQTQRLYIHDVITEKEATTSADEHLVTSGPSATEADLYLTSILHKALTVKGERSDTETRKQPRKQAREAMPEDRELLLTAAARAGASAEVLEYRKKVRAMEAQGRRLERKQAELENAERQETEKGERIVPSRAEPASPSAPGYDGTGERTVEGAGPYTENERRKAAERSAKS